MRDKIKKFLKNYDSLSSIDVGANAIAYTAYSMMQEYFHTKMELYRK